MVADVATIPARAQGTQETQMNTIAISGNTYPVKDQIKALGGKWDAARKSWMVPADRADAARKLVASAPRQSSYGSYSTIGQRQQYRMSRAGWTGCPCGSIEDRPRDSDCERCQHDY